MTQHMQDALNARGRTWGENNARVLELVRNEWRHPMRALYIAWETAREREWIATGGYKTKPCRTGDEPCFTF